MEARCELHLCRMHVRTVVEHLQGYARAELRRQRLVSELSALYGLSGLSDEQRQGVFHLPNLPAHVCRLCLYAIVACLGTLHACGARASELHLQCHHVPSLLGQRLHLVEYLLLAVEHEESIV